MAAVSTPHSGDWLFALPITTCGLRLDNEAVRVAVGYVLALTCVSRTLAPVVPWLMPEAHMAYHANQTRDKCHATTS